MQVSQQSTQQELARRLGIACGLGMGGLILIYAAVLIGGFLSLRSPDQPIGDPWFAGLEWLILFLAPLSVGLMAAINALAPQGRRLSATMALVFNDAGPRDNGGAFSGSHCGTAAAVLDA